MADNKMNGVQIQTAQLNPALKSLERLVGTWQISGDAQGQSTYEWAEGGFFLLQHVTLEYGRKIKGLEVIGHLQRPNQEPSNEIWTRFYSFLDGLTLDYVYELVDDTFTIWYGQKGSDDRFKGKFSADGNTITGGWEWPGGGYKVTMTRVK